MAGVDDIREGMQVLGSDGGMVGRVTGRHGDHLHLEPDAPQPGASDHMVPLRWVARVDQHVHLDRTAALVRDTWRSGEAGAPLPDAHSGIGRSRVVWLIGAVLLLIVIVLGIRGCGYAVSDSPAERESPPVDAPGV